MPQQRENPVVIFFKFFLCWREQVNSLGHAILFLHKFEQGMLFD